MDDLDEILVTRKTGNEPFIKNGNLMQNDLLSFWQWSTSDLVGNAMRGILAEYIVTLAINGAKGVRIEWDAYDIKSPEGIKIEVKSASYIQSWKQTKHSSIQFSIRPTKAWEPESSTRSQELKRQADVYVFCLLKHKDQNTINPLNLDQWEFYVLSTSVLNDTIGNQKTISLNSLINLKPIMSTFGNLSDSIKKAAKR